MPMVLRLASLLAPYPVSVVITDQPLAIGTVQGQRVVEAVRFVRRHRHSRYREPDPIVARWIDDEHLAIELEQGVKARVSWLAHG